MSEQKNLKKEILIFTVIVLIGLSAALYLVYKAAFCFDPYYVFRTEGKWPNRVLPCLSFNIFE